MKKNLLTTILILAVFTAIGQKLPFQGKLIQDGVAVDSSLTFEFSIPTLEWDETHADVTVTDGLYFVVLGSINALPDSLFYGTDQQSLNITVNGTVLSPVILFKPLSTPYEGRELNVRNLEGTIVGTIRARTDSVKHGELEIMGENTGKLEVGFFDSNDDSETDTPFLSLHKNDTVLSYLSASTWNNSTNGRLYLGSGNGDYANIYPNLFLGKHNGRYLFQLGHASWNNSENFGLLLLEGPNSRNFEITGQHWGNPDLPFFKMRGSENQDVLILSAEANDDESGNLNIYSKNGNSVTMSANQARFTTSDNNNAYIDQYNINLYSNNDKELNLTSERVSLRHTAENEWRETVILSSQNNNETGWGGKVDIMGPASTNVHIGSRDWESADLPMVNLHGENDFHGLELTITRDGNGDQFGWINLNSENGKSLNLSPDGIGVEKASLYTDINGGNKAGHLNLSGPNSNNISMGGKSWDDMDLPFIHMFGKNDGGGDFHALDLSVENNPEQRGSINLSETTGKHTWLNSTEVVLHNSSGNQAIALTTQDYGQGEVGNLRINGPSSTVFEFMPGWWDQPDRARLQLNGSTNHGRMNIGVTDDGQGNEHGEIYVHSSDQIESYVGPKDISLQNNGQTTVAISSQNNNNTGWGGKVDVMGPSTSNIHLGSKDWENADLPWLSLDGTRTNLMHLTAIGGATEFGYMHLISEDGSKSNISAYRIENDNGAGMVGYFGPDRTTFNDNGQEMTYNAGGISGNGTLNIGNDVTVNGTVTATEHIGTLSDKRFKKNIQTINYSLPKIKLIEGVSYDWRQDEFPEKNFSSDKQIGVIAQELEVQFPELVKTDKEGYKSVNYNGFTAVLLEAVKELNAKVEKLETENIQLKAELSSSQTNSTKIAQLKDQMDALVKMVQMQQTEHVYKNESVSTPGLK